MQTDYGTLDPYWFFIFEICPFYVYINFVPISMNEEPNALIYSLCPDIIHCQTGSPNNCTTFQDLGSNNDHEF